MDIQSADSSLNPPHSASLSALWHAGCRWCWGAESTGWRSSLSYHLLCTWPWDETKYSQKDEHKSAAAVTHKWVIKCYSRKRKESGKYFLHRSYWEPNLTLPKSVLNVGMKQTTQVPTPSWRRSWFVLTGRTAREQSYLTEHLRLLSDKLSVDGFRHQVVQTGGVFL